VHVYSRVEANCHKCAGLSKAFAMQAAQFRFGLFGGGKSGQYETA